MRMLMAFVFGLTAAASYADGTRFWWVWTICAALSVMAAIREA